MAWGRAGRQARAAAERRLAAVAGQWRPLPSPAAPPAPGPADPTAHRAEEPASLRWSGWTRPALRGLALLAVLIVLVVGYGAWQGRPRAVAQAPQVLATGVALPETADPAAPPAAPSAPPSPAPPAAPTPSAVEVVVHVTGLVARPGLVRLPQGARVADAVEAAGGVTRRRAAESVNLARVLVDGEQIVVTDAPAAGGGSGGAGNVSPAAPAVIDLNTATIEALDGLPGVGPVIASRIVAWRSANGPFRSVEELGEVSGIGDAILAQVRPLVRV